MTTIFCSAQLLRKATKYTWKITQYFAPLPKRLLLRYAIRYCIRTQNRKMSLAWRKIRHIYRGMASVECIHLPSYKVPAQNATAKTGRGRRNPKRRGTMLRNRPGRSPSKCQQLVCRGKMVWRGRSCPWLRYGVQWYEFSWGMTLLSRPITLHNTASTVIAVDITSTESKMTSWGSTKFAQSVPVHGTSTLPFHHPHVSFSVLNYYKYVNCLLNTHLQTKSSANVNRARRIQYDEPLPEDINNAGTNGPGCVLNVLSQYEEATQAPKYSSIRVVL